MQIELRVPCCKTFPRLRGIHSLNVVTALFQRCEGFVLKIAQFHFPLSDEHDSDLVIQLNAEPFIPLSPEFDGARSYLSVLLICTVRRAHCFADVSCRGER